MLAKKLALILRNKWVGHIFRIGIGALVLFFLVKTKLLDPQLLIKAVTTKPAWFAAAFLLYAVVLESFAFLRWYWLLRIAKVNISAWLVLKLHFIGLFFSGFLPGGTGGDLVKGYYLMRGRSKIEGAAAVGTIVLDRFAGLFGMIMTGAIANVISYKLWNSPSLTTAQQSMLSSQAISFIGLALISLIFVGIYLSPWKPHWLPSDDTTPGENGATLGFWKGLFISLLGLRETPLAFWGILSLSMSVHLSLVGVYVLCAQSLDVSLPFKIHAYVAPTLTLLNGLPLSPSGLGIGEAGGALLYKAVGATHGFSEIPALVHVVVMLTALLCAPVYLLQKKNAP